MPAELPSDLPSVLPGAEPLTLAGGPHGVLLLHGLTGSPQALRGLGEAFAEAGFEAEVPLLPGHGTTIDDLISTTWADWSACAEAAYEEMASGCDRVVVTGLSMGATLAVWLATHNPDMAGVIAINPMIDPPAPTLRQWVRGLLAEGHLTTAPICGDIADPDANEVAYDALPLEGLLSLFEAQDELFARLALVRCPLLLMTSPQDHVVPPVSSDLLAQRVSGPVERVSLSRSYHVATLDYDRGEITRRAVAFARRVAPC